MILMYRAEHQELRSVYARALHVLHGDLGNHDSSSLLETSSTSFVRDTGAMVYEIRGLRHRYSVTGRHGVKKAPRPKSQMSDRNVVADRPNFALCRQAS